MLISAFVGGVIDLLIYRNLRHKKASNLVMLLASFGVFIFIQNIVALLYGSQVLSLRIGPVKEGVKILGAFITPIQILIIATALFVFIFLIIVIEFTKAGKATRAVSDSSIVASTIGIDPDKMILFAFTFGSALAGLAGVLISLETSIEPTMGFNMLLKGVIAVIIGGIGTIRGALVGSLFLGFAENLSVWFLPAGWKDAIVFSIFLVFLMFRPQGILGKRES